MDILSEVNGQSGRASGWVDGRSMAALYLELLTANPQAPIPHAFRLAYIIAYYQQTGQLPPIQESNDGTAIEVA